MAADCSSTLGHDVFVTLPPWHAAQSVTMAIRWHQVGDDRNQYSLIDLAVVAVTGSVM